jgi:hypothetical protein
MSPLHQHCSRLQIVCILLTSSLYSVHLLGLALHPYAVPRLHSLEWRVDYLLASSFLTTPDTNSIRLQLRVQAPNAAAAASAAIAAALTSSSPAPTSSALDALLAPAIAPQLLAFSLTPEQYKLLYADLKQAQQILARA